MPKLTLGQVLRYGTAGFLALALLQAFDGGIVKSIIALVNPVGLLAATTGCSVVFYFVYRVAVHQRCILPLHDRFRWHSDNYRTFLSKEYKLSGQKANQVYWHIRDEKYRDQYKEYVTYASAAHAFYQASLVLFMFAVAATATARPALAAALAVICPMSFAVGWAIDRGLEERELALIRMMPRHELTSVVDAFFATAPAPEAITGADLSRGQGDG